jgi:DNA-binding response OmpR family regulator
MAEAETDGAIFESYGGKLNLRGKRVLIVDDDRLLLKALEIRCRSTGLSVDTAADAGQTMAKIAGDAPDLLIVDQNLSDVDGFKLVELIGKRRFPAIPVIMFTGRSDATAMERCKKLGAHYLHKGIGSWDQLETLLYDLLGNCPPQSTPGEAARIKAS